MRRGFLLICCTAAFLAFTPMPAKAHRIYSHLTDKSGRSCCSNSDCQAAPYRVTPSGVQMLVKGAWVLVPRERVQYRLLDGDTGETAGGHWCGEPYDGGFITYCAFLPPTMALTSPLLR
jgi:hypothetical protein